LLENDSRLCLCSFISAEFDDLPEPVKKEVQAFAGENVDWLIKLLSAAGLVSGLSPFSPLSALSSWRGAGRTSPCLTH
jgi:hypothetical protein